MQKLNYNLFKTISYTDGTCNTHIVSDINVLQYEKYIKMENIFIFCTYGCVLHFIQCYTFKMMMLMYVSIFNEKKNVWLKVLFCTFTSICHPSIQSKSSKSNHAIGSETRLRHIRYFTLRLSSKYHSFSEYSGGTIIERFYFYIKRNIQMHNICVKCIFEKLSRFFSYNHPDSFRCLFFLLFY